MPDTQTTILDEISTLIGSQLSAELATVSESGTPCVSYAPFIYGAKLTLIVFLSDLAQHTHNLAANKKISAMIIKDESKSSNLFARERLVLDCQATKFERNSKEFDIWIPQYRERFGAIVDTLVQLADFNLYSLSPERGTYVKGFGQAYRIFGRRMNQVEHITNPAKEAEIRKS